MFNQSEKAAQPHRGRRTLALMLTLALMASTSPAGFGATAASPAAVQTAVAKTAASALAKGVDSLLTEMQKKTGFSGSVILAQKGTVLLNKGYGYANEEYKIVNGPKTVFRYASLSKQLTAAGVLKLEETGKLSLKDPLSKFIPDYPRGGEITLEMLLNHTSGLRDDVKHTGLTQPELTRLYHTPKELVELIKAEPLATEPGETYFYSNHGYILLGYCIEKASGMSYEAYLNKAVFSPLGIKDIQYDQGSAIVPNRAEGYKLVKGKKVKADWIDMSNPYAAGALMGTAEAYLKWQQSYYSPKLMSKASWDKLFSGSVRTYRTALLDEQYGLGVMTTHLTLGSGDHAKVVYHTGGVNGFRAFQIHIDRAELDFVLLSNNESLDLESLLAKVLVVFMPFL